MAKTLGGKSWLKNIFFILLLTNYSTWISQHLLTDDWWHDLAIPQPPNPTVDPLQVQ